MADDFAATINTTGRVLVNGPGVNGNIEAASDHDWFQIWLWAGHTYAIKEDGSGVNAGNTLPDPIVALHNSAGTILVSNDDGGAGNSSYLRYEAPTSGYYYVDAGAFSSYVGTYQVHVDQQADRLSTPNLWVTGSTSSDRLADFSGDGKDDLLQISSNGTISVATSSADGSGFGAYHVFGSGATVGDQIGDFNGNGTADLLQIYNGTAYVALSNGTSFGAYTAWLPNGVQSDVRHVYANFDNGQDLLQITSGGSVQVALSNATSFQPFVTSNIGASASDQISSGHNFYGDRDVTRSDFNGDGLADLLQVYNGKDYVSLSQGNGHFGAYSVWSGSGGAPSDTFGDFNGDGKADLYQYYNGTAYVALSNGSSFGSFQVFATGVSATDQITDMNGDGRADLYQVYQGRAYVALAQGNDASPSHIGSTHYDVWATGVADGDKLGDVNGDGLTDVVHLDSSGATVYASQPVAGADQHLIFT